MDKNTTRLAGEFLVAGELSRRGIPVSITIGNAKSIDIIASTAMGDIKIETKAGRTKSNWPISKELVAEDSFYIFVYLKTANQIEKNMPPEYYIVPGFDLIENNLIAGKDGKQSVKYSDLDDVKYRNRWDKLEKDLR